MNYLELEAISISMRILTGITNSALSYIDISIICKLDYAIKHACIQNQIELIFSCTVQLVLLLRFGRGMLRRGRRSQSLPKPLSVISIHGGQQRFGVPIAMRKRAQRLQQMEEERETKRRGKTQTQTEELPPEYKKKTSSTGFSPVLGGSENLSPHSGYPS